MFTWVITSSRSKGYNNTHYIVEMLQWYDIMSTRSLGQILDNSDVVFSIGVTSSGLVDQVLTLFIHVSRF